MKCSTNILSSFDSTRPENAYHWYGHGNTKNGTTWIPKRQFIKTDFEATTDAQKTRISRTPLGRTEISTLIQTAIDLHARALEHKRELRWWVPVLVGFVGVLLGAAITASW